MERITSRRNPICMHLKKLGADRSYREAHGEFLCDGKKLLEDAVNDGAKINSVITASNIPFQLPIETRVYYAQRSLVNSISPLKNAQDTLFSCAIPPEKMSIGPDGTHILLDCMQDPGNVGTIIRTANAFGISSVILTEGCADPYNPKTIRASMGAIFRQRICHISVKELAELKNIPMQKQCPGDDAQNDSRLRFIGASLGDGCKDISEVDMGGSVIAIGSEGRGLSEAVLTLCDIHVRIPIVPQCESLNAAAAAAIIIWESRGKSDKRM